jgi:signal transduction histidine kinase
MRFLPVSFLLFITLQVCSAQSVEKNQLDSLLAKLEYYSDRGVIVETDSLLKVASAMIDESTQPLQIIKYNYHLAHSFLSKWDFDRAEPLFEKNIQLATELQDTSALVASMGGLATIKTYKGELMESIRLQESAKDMIVDIDSSRYYGLTANLAIAYEKTFRYDKALTNFLAAKGFFERQGNAIDQALMENNLGELYREHFQDFEMAEKHYRRAIKLNEASDGKVYIGMNYHNLSLNFLHLEEVDSALYYVNKSIAVKKEMGEEGKLAADYFLLGDILLFQESYEEAIAEFGKTLRISRDLGIPLGLYHGNLGLARAYAALDKNHLALDHGTLALEAAKRMEAPSLLQSAYEWMYVFYKDRKDYKKAILFFERFHAIDDSLNEVSDAQILNSTRAEYETDLARAESEKLLLMQEADKADLEYNRMINFGLLCILVLLILLILFIYKAYKMKGAALRTQSKLNDELTESHEKISKQAEELAKLDRLKTSIVSVLGHDLRGPLTSVASLVEMVSDKSISATEFDELVQQLGSKTHSGIKSLDLVLEWSRLKAGDSDPKIESLNPEPTIDEIIELNKEMILAKEIKVNIKIKNELSIPADRNQFKSIATNLVSNAIKFSKKGGRIEIGTEVVQGYVNLFVRDAGDGFSDELLEMVNTGSRILSSPGTEGEVGTGIGLRIVRDFVDAHKGKLHFSNHPEGGGRAIVSFPLIQDFAEVSEF